MARLADIFDRIFLERFFQRKERSAVVFYPFTRKWRGYELPSHREADLRCALRIQVVASIIVALWLAFIVPKMALGDTDQTWTNWLGLFFWFAFLVLVMIYSRFSLARGFALADPKMPERECKSPRSVNSGEH